MGKVAENMELIETIKEDNSILRVKVDAYKERVVELDKKIEYSSRVIKLYENIMKFSREESKQLELDAKKYKREVNKLKKQLTMGESPTSKISRSEVDAIKKDIKKIVDIALKLDKDSNILSKSINDINDRFKTIETKCAEKPTRKRKSSSSSTAK